MRWLCTVCDVIYGVGENKPRFGYCPGCWRLWLAQCAKGVRVAYAKRCEERGVESTWNETSAAPKETK